MNPLTVTDMHTGGEPLRIVTSGYPALPKGTILEKRAHVRDHGRQRRVPRRLVKPMPVDSKPPSTARIWPLT